MPSPVDAWCTTAVVQTGFIARPRTFVLTAGRLWDEAKNVAALADVAPTLTWPVYLAGEPVALSGCHLWDT